MDDELLNKINIATRNASKIITEELVKISYFNPHNLSKNKDTFSKVLTYDGNALPEHALAAYIVLNNTLVIDIEKMDKNIDIDDLTMLILHELIHMASADIDKKIVGFDTSGLPISYNEALTQYLTLKLFYKKLDEALAKNKVYLESVKLLSEMLKEFKEEEIYTGFFDADIHKSIDYMDKDKKSKWIDYILKFSFLNEQKNIESSFDSYNELLSKM